MKNDIIFYLIPFLFTFIGTLIFTPIFSRIAVKMNIIDNPGDHKIHAYSRPLLGGLALFLLFSVTIFLFLQVDNKLFILIIAALIIVITGLIDDIYSIKPSLKLAGQFAAASLVVFGNRYMYIVFIDYFEKFHVPGYVVLGLIIGWIVLMVNAFNLIDGLDGLAVGTSAIIFLAMTALSIISSGSPNILGVQIIGFAACLGFLLYNFYPAKIFMGDAGSMLLGFVLATTHLFTVKYPFSAQLVLGSMFIFAYPALDISYTIFRRFYNKVTIFQADRGHIHHVLLSLGFSVRKTVLLIYLVNIFFASIAILLLAIDIPTRYLFIIGIIILLFVVFLFRRLLLISKSNGI